VGTASYGVKMGFGEKGAANKEGEKKKKVKGEEGGGKGRKEKVTRVCFFWGGGRSRWSE